MEKGFTLIEVILAICILTIAVGGSFTLIQQTLASVSLNQSKLIASYLTQEGIEIVRNIRDTNWLKIHQGVPDVFWDDGIVENNCLEADYISEFLSLCGFDPEGELGRYLKIDGDFYNYTTGEPTKFKRKITITDKEDLDGDAKPDKMKVLVQVQWKERGRTHNLEALEYLYNWYVY